MRILLVAVLLAVASGTPAGADIPVGAVAGRQAVRMFNAGTEVGRAVDRNPVIVGDSVLNMSRTEFDVGIVNAQNGRSGDSNGYGDPSNFTPGWGDPGTGLEAVSELADKVASGGWIVIELGTNDIYHRPSGEFERFATDVVRAIPDGVCVGWVVPWAPAFPQRSLEVADIIADVLDGRSCSGLIRWDVWVRGDPSLVIADGVHPTAGGMRRLAWLIYLAVGLGP